MNTPALAAVERRLINAHATIRELRAARAAAAVVVEFAALGLADDTPNDRTVARYNDVRLTAGQVRSALAAVRKDIL